MDPLADELCNPISPFYCTQKSIKCCISFKSTAISRHMLIIDVLLTTINRPHSASDHVHTWPGSGIAVSTVVRVPDSWLKGCRFESLQEQQENFLLRGRLSVLLFWYPFHPRVTAVARKRSRSFCQKCRWQVTAKHAYTLRMCLCMKWHGCMVYTERAETAAVSCGTSRASAVSKLVFYAQSTSAPSQCCEYTTSVNIQKRTIKN